MTPTTLPTEIRLATSGRRRECFWQRSQHCQDYRGVIMAVERYWEGVCVPCLDDAGYRSICERPTVDENDPGYTDSVCANCGRLDCSPIKMVR